MVRTRTEAGREDLWKRVITSVGLFCEKRPFLAVVAVKDRAGKVAVRNMVETRGIMGFTCMLSVGIEWYVGGLIRSMLG
jgi:hypothetical protein